MPLLFRFRTLNRCLLGQYRFGNVLLFGGERVEDSRLLGNPPLAAQVGALVFLARWPPFGAQQRCLVLRGHGIGDVVGLDARLGLQSRGKFLGRGLSGGAQCEAGVGQRAGIFHAQDAFVASGPLDFLQLRCLVRNPGGNDVLFLSRRLPVANSWLEVLSYFDSMPKAAQPVMARPASTVVDASPSILCRVDATGESRACSCHASSLEIRGAGHIGRGDHIPAASLSPREETAHAFPHPQVPDEAIEHGAPGLDLDGLFSGRRGKTDITPGTPGPSTEMALGGQPTGSRASMTPPPPGRLVVPQARLSAIDPVVRKRLMKPTALH